MRVESVRKLVLAAVAGACSSGAFGGEILADPPPPPPAEETTGLMEAWTGTFELGFNGSEGNAETFAGRALLGGKRETDRNVTTASIGYIYGSQDGKKNKSRGEANVRNDFKLEKGSPWRIFATGKLEYDEFQDWDFRISGFVGVAYAFIENDRTTLLGRIGPGFSKKIGGDDDKVRFELDIGADFSHKITERQKITLSADYYPNLSDFPGYRFVAKGAYEVLVDPETKMSLKIGAEDRFDSNPGAGRHHNDFEYYGLLVWAF